MSRLGGPEGLGRSVRLALLRGVSSAAIATFLAATPAQAQLASLRSALGVPTTLGSPVPAATNTVTAVTPTMSQIMARHNAYEARIQATAGMVAQANAAARAAAAEAAKSVPDGLTAGGLDPVTVTLTSANDPTGLSVWEGASAPTQTQSGAAVNVTIDQSQSRALLSWNSFNIGANTTLTFNQQGNPGWVVVNRVVGAIDPLTGLVDPTKDIKPTQIFGTIKADGSVYILDRAGVMFGATSQINLHSLVASSLELGSATVPATSTTLRDVSLQERNDSFLTRGILTDTISGLVSAVPGEHHGNVSVASGAQINATGGYVILAAPNVSSAGEISNTVGGQVSLEAGTQIDATSSSGAADSADPFVRGLILSSLGGGSVTVTGSIDVPEGYVSLGTDLTGTINFGGLISSTTGVSRNAKISLIGGIIDIANGAAISIAPDTSGATIPDSADSLAAFKSSQIDIGSHNYTTEAGRITPTEGAAFDLLPAAITIGANSTILAPNANVSIGGRTGDATHTVDELPTINAKVDIGDNAVIDVSGVADYLLDASRNVLEISPAKGNELRDTPNYRNPSTNGSFTLNGQTLFVDPRLSGVRADGVAWIGSPLIEAGSLAAQIGITAPELMTSGGNVTLATLGFKPSAPPAAGAYIPSISLAPTATVDFSGGWVRYSAGQVHYSKLLTADGRLVDISQADPNDNFVAVGDGFVEQLPQLSTPTVFANTVLQGTSFDPGYVEGHDAGSLTIKAPTGSFNAQFHGDAVAGDRQIGAGKAASRLSTLAGDIRLLQANPNQLPSAGLLHIQSIPGADVEIGTASADSSKQTILLDPKILNAAHLGALSLQTSGKVTVDASADLNLAPGGAFNADAGRTITFNGDISVPAGTISAQTYGVQSGNIFDASDDLPADAVLTSGEVPRLFDIIVNDGSTLSVRGRWDNDSLASNPLQYDGPGYTSGGSINLTSAAHVEAIRSAGNGAVDLSGSILLKPGSLLDASGGGYVSPTGNLSLSGKGGNVSLVDDTNYFESQAIVTVQGKVPTGLELFRSDLSSFQITPDDNHSPALVPDAVNSTVELDGEIRSFGFKGGGTFTLVTPELKFGSSDSSGTYIPLDFLAHTGFATLSLSAWKTAIIDNVFSNGITGKTALLATNTIQVHSGETLNLTQSILPSILNTDQINLLDSQASGTDVSKLSAIAPTNQLGPWDNLPANLSLGGLTELDILGGTITGAPTASITAPRIYNAGTIQIAGGSISQKLTLPASYIAGPGSRDAIGVHQVVDANGIDYGAGLSLVFGSPDAAGKFDENAPNALGISLNGNVISNRDLVGLAGSDRQIYYLGTLDANQGIVLAPGSVTDLSGVSIRNPRAALIPGSSRQIATGRLVNGGAIGSAGLFYSSNGLFSPTPFSEKPYTFFNSNGVFIPEGSTPALQITAAQGSVLNLSGASDTFDIQTGANVYTPTPVWSNAGTISALGGGDVSKASINAHGGAPGAEGGTFEWLNPVLVQSGSNQDGIVSADQIEGAGFDTFIARGDVTTIGDVDLSLGRDFILTARNYSGAPLSTTHSTTGDTLPYADPYYAISIGATGAFSVTAPHIALLGIDQTIASLADHGVGSLALHGGSMDIFGAVAFRNSLSSVLLESQSDIRLIGVEPLSKTLTPAISVDAPSLSGQVIAGGDLTFRASQVYATSGSGNLQTLTQSADAQVVRPFVIGSTGTDATVRFESNGSPTPAIPYSAGSYVSVVGANIDQAGVLRAPLGRIDLGSATGFQQGTTGFAITVGATHNVTLEPGSVTSVSLGNLKIPYGTTTDLTDYFFDPVSSSPLTGPPAAELRFGGANISVLSGATVDTSGGTGDIYAYEFVSGTGGSRDVLSRFNSDAFSSNNGFQYPDGRQVYAIVPAGSAQAALYDPIYSAGYGSLYGADAGKIVHLDGGNGVPAGDYILLPGQYAMLPGAMRLVENVGTAPPLPGQYAELRDGSVIVSGNYAIAGTNESDWQRRSFTVESQAVFSKYSQIDLTSGTTKFTSSASSNGTVTPRLPADAGRLVFTPTLSLVTNGNFDTTPAQGGRGSEVDIAAAAIDVVSQATAPTSGVLTLVADDLGALNAASLFLGGIRTDLADGSTNLKITAHQIDVRNDINHPLSAPEILLAVDGIGSKLNLADGASIVATGELSDPRTGDYNVASYTTDSGGNIVADNTGAGSVFRLANGAERLVNRSGALADSVTTKPVTYSIGKVNLSGTSLTLDTSRQLNFNAASSLDVHHIAISGDNVAFSSRSYGLNGLVITPELEQAFSVADDLTIRANSAIGFTAGIHSFNDLTLLAPGLRLIRTQRDASTTPLSVTINARDVKLGNLSGDSGACRGNGPFSCGNTGNNLVINSQALTLSSGTFHTYGFDRSVALNAPAGMYYNGVGALDVGIANLSLTTPFLVDRGSGAQPTNSASPEADLELRTTGTVDIAAGLSTALPSGALAPGARIAIGSLAAPVENISINGTLLRATAGTIEAYSKLDVQVTGAATLATPSYSQTFGDSADPVTVSANGGTISLVALGGGIDLSPLATLAIGGATGSAGTLNLLASNGQVNLSGTINSAAPGAGASLNFDAGQSAFDLGAFLAHDGSEFTGDIAIRTGVGDLVLASGQDIKAQSLSLTADGGSTVIGGTIDTSGVNGGNIYLFASNQVSLLSSALLNAQAAGYADTDTRQASAGNVLLGVGQNGVINVASGAAIDLQADRAGDRLVPKTQTDPTTLNTTTSYTYVQGDRGGTLTLRAPAIEQSGLDTVNVNFAGSVAGARDVSVEGYRSYDLSVIAANPLFTGVTVDHESNVATLDLTSTAAGRTNFLAGVAPGTIADFVQNFDISADRSNLGVLPSLSVYHERPGVELDHSGTITLASNWNLGAGTVNVPAAVAAGDMRLSALGPYADGSPRYEVVPGHEAHLFQNFVEMTYRVGRNVAGAAPVVTLRAGTDLNIAHSITDGFFAFSDQTDPNYINTQLGGGVRSFNPAISVQCGVGGANATSCADVLPFNPAAAPSQRTAINFNLTAIVRGSENQPGIAPYSAAANSPAALGLFAGGAGDPIGSAQIFPLLAGGASAQSSSIQLVGGAGATVSSNPLHIDRASNGSVIVSGESTYQIQATKPTGTWGGTGELSYQVPGSANQYVSDDFLASLSRLTNLDPTTLGNSTAHVQFGAVVPAAENFMRSAAQQFFAKFPGQVHYLGPKANPTGFEAPVALVIQFLQSTDSSGVPLINRFSAMIVNGTLPYQHPTPTGVIDPPGAFARVHTLVRTGTGSIEVAAAANVDLTNGPAHLLSENAQPAIASSSNAAQEGGSAIYTVGQVVAPTEVAARIAGSQQVLTIDPSSYAIASDARSPLWVPTSTGRLQDNPIYAANGGSISVTAGSDVLGRRDVWNEAFNSNNPAAFTRGGIDHSPTGANIAGSSDQRWRIGSIGLDSSGNPELATNIRVNPQLFSSGIGTLGGGNISIEAGHDVRELSVALDTTVTTGAVGSSFGSMVFGGGNLTLDAGHDILGGRFDVASGVGKITAGRDIDSSGKLIVIPQPNVPPASIRTDNLPEIRLTDAQVDVTAGGSARIGAISALGTDSGDAPGVVDHQIDQNALGYYTGQSSVAIEASGNVSLAGEPTPFNRLYALNSGTYVGAIMPSSLEVTSFDGDINLGKTPLLMYPGANGQLSLLAGGTLDPATIDLDDGDPSLMPGIFSALNFDTRENLLFAGRPFSLPITLPGTNDLTRQLYHSERPLHAEDSAPARIAVGGDLVDLTLFSAKATRVSATHDIINMMFVGQNLSPDDVTRISAGRNITATVAGAFSSNTPDLQAILGRSVVGGNQYILGGPGSFYVEAGGNLGPFLPSSTIIDTRTGQPVHEDIPGGILSVGNDYNPWLPAKSADVYAFFGVASGMDFDALRETYVNPANAGQLPDALFEQITDPFGNKSADRTKPIYSKILINWMQQNEAAALIAADGTTNVTAAQAYSVFASLPELVQRKFLLADVYFNELQAPSRPDNVSYLKYARGYTAVNTLFPPSLGYTANDLSGQHNGGTRVETGNLDLRLATIQTTRGGDITILGPGGNAILGSVVRTSTQAASRAYQPSILDGYDQNAGGFRPDPIGASYTVPVLSIPIGYEGVLTLRGGNVYGFTDGDFRLNQSRLFTEQSGDITLWSSNGDLNAGQGPKSAANVPPIVVRFDPNGFSEVDSAGAVTGAGIAGFTGISRLNPETGDYELVNSFNDSDFTQAQLKLVGLPSGSQVQVNGKTYRKDAPTITLIAPAGTVDAGDAGVRAGGDVFVAAARVANADNFKVGGQSIGIPSAAPTAPPTPPNAASAITANVFRATNPNGPADERVRILVDVLGFYSGSTDKCPPDSTDPQCKSN